MIQKPRGTMDIMPEETPVWQYIEKAAREVASMFGFKEIRTPTFEATELFQRGVGDTTDVVQKEMYTFIDREERSFTLRPEGNSFTSSTASAMKNRKRAEAASFSSSERRCSAHRMPPPTAISSRWRTR